VTRIPPRFQKQRPSANQHQASEKAFGALPRATSRTAPSTAKQLTIFGTSNVVNNLNESELGEDLSIPVRLIAAMKLGDFKEKIAMVDPEKDRLILIHGLGNDARNIGKFTFYLNHFGHFFVVCQKLINVDYVLAMLKGKEML
jgi:hypothetical protein